MQNWATRLHSLRQLGPMTKKVQNLWRTIEHNEQRSLTQNPCFPYCQRLARGEQVHNTASLTGRPSKKCVECILTHVPCGIAHVGVNLFGLLSSIAETLR